MIIDNKPKVPTIPDPPQGVPPLEEVQGDPRGGDGGGGGVTRDGTKRGSRRIQERRMLGAWKEEQRGQEEFKRGSRRSQSWIGQARNAAKKEDIWRMNRDGTWRRLQLAKSGPCKSSNDKSEDLLKVTESFFDPSTKDNPEHFTSFIIRSQQGNPLSLLTDKSSYPKCFIFRCRPS